MLDVHHAREIIGERGGLPPVFSQMLFQPFPDSRQWRAAYWLPLAIVRGSAMTNCTGKLSSGPMPHSCNKPVNPIHFLLRHVMAKHRQIVFIRIHNVIRPS